ncbi:MAG: DGQHR domain-containing protein [Chloroflexi bacterium]|nr:DGQHR domain-containing protein [Chloroflexota bacterium]
MWSERRRRQPMRLELPGIGYQQGNRQMVVTALNPVALVKTVTSPDRWNPLGKQPHGNRPQDKGHREGIAQYLEEEENFVLGAVVLYASPRDAMFEPAEGDSNGPVRPGTLKLEFGAEFDVGDGQHRIGAYSDVMARHDEDGDPILERLRASGQPAVVVIDDEPLHRAQDFTDLQRNAKPPSNSIALSMDRRQPVNRMLIDLVQDAALPVFDLGERVEFLKDSPGKLSAKLYSFNTIRYMSGTALIGTGQRSARGWDKAVNAAIEEHPDASRAGLVAFWQAFAALPPIAAIIGGESTPAKLREETLLGAAGVLYALAAAAHEASDVGMDLGEAVSAFQGVNFARPAPPPQGSPLTLDDSIFVGTLIDAETAKVGSGRPSWEAAADHLLEAIKQMRAAA